MREASERYADHARARVDERRRRLDAAIRQASAAVRDTRHALDVANGARGRVPADESDRAIVVDDEVAKVQQKHDRAEALLKRVEGTGTRGSVQEAVANAREAERCATTAKEASATAVRWAR